MNGCNFQIERPNCSTTKITAIGGRGFSEHPYNIRKLNIVRETSTSMFDGQHSVSVIRSTCQYLDGNGLISSSLFPLCPPHDPSFLCFLQRWQNLIFLRCDECFSAHGKHARNRARTHDPSTAKSPHHP